MLISNLNRRVPTYIRFIFSLILLNIPVIYYLTKVGPRIAPIYVAIIFLLFNVVALITYFKIKEIEVDLRKGRLRIRK